MDCPSRVDHRVAIVLFSTDACFVLLHLGARHGWLFDDPLLSLYRDRGYAEWFQYTKELWAFLLLAILAARRRSPMLLAFSLLFLYLLLDDSLQLHETLGGIVARRGALQPHLGLKPQDLGELAVSAAVGAAFLVPIGLCYLRSDGDTRRIARWILGLTVLLAVFGVLLDAVNEAVAIPGLHLLEDAGEMLAMSAIVTFVFGLLPARLASPGGEPPAI